MKYNLVIHIGLVALIMLFFSSVYADTETGEKIDWQVISGGGGINGISPDYKLSGTISQTATGGGSSTDYKISHGFWQDFGGGSGDCCDYAGDSKNDGNVNLLDVTYTIAFLYKDGPPSICPNEADSRGDCNINLLDVTFTIAFLYKGGPPPVCGCVE